MKKLKFTFLAAIVFFGFAVNTTNAQTTLLDEGFEDAWSGDPAAPTNWTQIEVESSSHPWEQAADGEDYATIHSGTYSARGPFGDGEYLLITPALDLSGGNYRLKFWLDPWSTYGAELYVLAGTSNNSAADFTDELAHYTPVNASYEQKTIDLSSYTSTIYIAFKMSNSISTYSWCIDDVLVEEIPSIPVISVDPVSLDYGTIESGTVASLDVTINNTGAVDLVISGATVASPFSCSYAGIITAGGNVTATINFNPTSIGDFVDSVLTFNSNATTGDSTVTLTGHAFPAGLDFQGFEDATFPPEGWEMSANWTRSTTVAYEGSASAYVSGADSWLFTPKLEITTGDQISFYYRAESSSHPSALKIFLAPGASDQTNITAYTETLVTISDIDSEDWTLETYTFDATHDGETVYLAFNRYWQESTSWFAFIDNVIFPPIWVNPNAESGLSATSYDFGLIETGTDSIWQVIITNNGLADLDITTAVADPFFCTYSGITPSGETDAATITFSPTTAGDFEETLEFNFSGDGDSLIVLTGSAYPAGYVTQGFEDDAFPPEFWCATEKWSQVLYGGHNSSNFTKCSYAAENDTLMTPRLDMSTGDHHLYFYWKEAGTNNNDSVIVKFFNGTAWSELGVVGKGSDDIWTYESFDLGNSISDSCFIMWNYVGGGTFEEEDFKLDDVIHAEVWINPNPEITLNENAYDFGTMAVGISSSTSDTNFVIKNIGSQTLTITNVTNLSGTEFSTTLVQVDVTLSHNETYTFGFTYSPVDDGDDNLTFTIQTNGGDVDIDLSGSAYVLPDGMVEIGTGLEYSQSLPMEPNSDYSYSQSILLQGELNTAGKRIEKLYYHFNGYSSFTDDIVVYMGHTALTEFATDSSWVTIDNLTEVYNGPMIVIAEDSWVEIILSTPFEYNNTDNLVIAFDENTDAYCHSNNDFYCTSTGDVNMSIEEHYPLYGDIDPADPPDGYLKTYRPNVRLQFEDIPVGPAIMVNPQAYNFGLIEAGTSVSFDVYIYNTGTTALTVTGASVGSQFSCTYSATIAAGAADTAIVSFEPTTAGDYNADLTFSSDAVQGDNIVSLEGSAHPAGYVEQGFEDAFPPEGWSITDKWSQSFDEHSGSYSAYCSSYAFNDTLISPRLDMGAGDHYVYFWWKEYGINNEDSVIIKLSTDNGGTWADLATIGGGSNDEWIFETFDLGTPLSDECFIMLNYVGDSINAANFYIDDILHAPLWVDPVPVISFDEYAFNFGTVAVGASSSRDVKIYNIGNIDDLVITGVAVIAPYSCTYSGTIAAGDTATATIVFTPTAVSEFSQTATFTITIGFDGDNTIDLYGNSYPVGHVFEDFESETFPPLAWVMTSGWARNTVDAYVYQGEASARVAVDSTSWLFTPKLSITTGDMIQFYYRTESATYPSGLQVLLAPGASTQNDITAYTVTLIEIDTVDETDWNLATYTFDGTYNGQEVYLAFNRYWQESTLWYAYIDNVVLPPYPAVIPEAATDPFPADSVVDMLLETELTWSGVFNATGYKINFGTDYPPTNIENGIDLGDMTSYQATGLDYSTDYYWQIVPYNATGNAADCPVWMFTAMDDPLVIEFPWFEGFEDSEWFGDPAAPLGWTQISVSGNKPWKRTTLYSHTGTYAAKGPYALDGGEHLLITPPVDLSNGDYRLRFWLKGSSYETTNLFVYAGTSNASASDFTDSLAGYIVGENMPIGYELQEIDLSAYSGTIYFAFKLVDDDGFSIYIDDIRVEEIPTTPMFTITPDYSDFGPVNMYETSYAEDFTITNTGIGILDITSVSIGGANADQFILTDTNSYPVEIAVDTVEITFDIAFAPASVGTKSATIIVVQDSAGTDVTHEVEIVGTGVDPTLYPPFLEDFVDGYEPNNWTEAQGLLVDTVDFGITTYSNWKEGEFPGDSANVCAKLNIFGQYADEWMFTAPIDLGDGSVNYQLEFDLALTTWNTSDPDTLGGDDLFAVVISTDNGATWLAANVLHEWDSTTIISGTGNHAIVSLVGYTGVVKLGFYGESTIENKDVDLFVDNIAVNPIPDIGITAIIVPVSACELSDVQDITVTISNLGDATVVAGEEILVVYKLDDNAEVTNTLILDADLAPGSDLDYTFDETVNMSAVGDYSLTAYTIYAGDLVAENDTIYAIISVYGNPVVDLGDDQAVCEGETVTLDASAGFDAYLWSTGETTQTIDVIESGTYSVVVTDANGCTGTDEVVVTVNPNPIVDLGSDQIVSAGEIVTLDAGAGLYSYLWSDGSINQTLEVTETGTYSVTITDANGCTGSDEIIITFTGINELTNNSQISVYPNPNKGEFNLVIINEKAEDLIIELVNIQGQVIYINNVKNVIIFDEKIDVSGFAKGIYYLKVNKGNGMKVEKIIMQ